MYGICEQSTKQIRPSNNSHALHELSTLNTMATHSQSAAVTSPLAYLERRDKGHVIVTIQSEGRRGVSRGYSESMRAGERFRVCSTHMRLS